MKAIVAAFNQEKALVGAFSVITNLRMELFEALVEPYVPLSHLMLIASRPAAWSAGSLRARVRPLVVMAIVSRPGSAFSRATSSTASPRTSGSPPVSRIWADSREQTRTLTRWSHLLDALGHEDPRDLDDLVRGEEIW